jgi:FlgD Ig-like domain
MKYLVITTLFVVLCFGANLIKAPNIEAVQIIGNPQTTNTTYAPPPKMLDRHIIDQIPDIRCIGGSPGKNIVFAEDGQSIAIIYCIFSGDPTNFMQVYVAYSTDRSNTWAQYGPLSTFNCRRAYPAVDAEDDFYLTGRIYYTWQQTAQLGGSYDSSSIYYAQEVSFPDGLITAALRLPNSSSRDVWFPCIGVKDSFVIITATNNSTFLTTNNTYIWRSTNYGGSWDTGRLFIPGPLAKFGPHFRFGNNGYMFFLWFQQQESNPALYWPYYCESFDYAVTWTEPRPIWDDTLPYPDMSNVTGWWYTYDCAVVNDTPVAAMKLGSGTYDYGELWVYRPDRGIPGNWHFLGTKLISGDSTAPQTLERYATLAQDDRGDIFVGYQAIFETPTDTGPDVGMFVRPYNRNIWLDYGNVTHNFDTIEEKELEFAHNAPLVPDSAVVGMIYTDAADYPTTGNLYFDWVAVETVWIDTATTGITPSIAYANRPVISKPNFMVKPNPFRNSIKFIIPPHTGETKISIFDVTGKLVKTLTTKNQKPTTDLVWDGRNENGHLTNPGIYFYTVTIGNNKCQGKIILTR